MKKWLCLLVMCLALPALAETEAWSIQLSVSMPEYRAGLDAALKSIFPEYELSWSPLPEDENLLVVSGNGIPLGILVRAEGDEVVQLQFTAEGELTQELLMLSVTLCARALLPLAEMNGIAPEESPKFCENAVSSEVTRVLQGGRDCAQFGGLPMTIRLGYEEDGVFRFHFTLDMMRPEDAAIPTS